MVMIKDRNGVERFSIHQRTFNLCMKYKEKISNPKYNTMIFGIVSGKKGSGKSLLAQYLGHMIDETLEGDITRICHTTDEFIDAVINNRRKVIIADEGVSIFYRRNAMTKSGRTIAEFWEQIRLTNNCIIICVPKLTSLDSTILNPDDINFVANVWETAKENSMIKMNYQIFLNFNPTPRLATSYVYYEFALKNGKKAKKPPYFVADKGQLTKESIWHPVGEKEYRKKKDKILLKYLKPKKEVVKKKGLRTIKKEMLQEIIIKAKEKNPNFTYKMIAEVLNYSPRRVISLAKEGMKGNLAQKEDSNGGIGE